MVFPGETPTTYGGFCIRFRKNDSRIETGYLLRILKMDSVRQKMAGRGANIQNLNQQILSQLNILLPPIDLQEKYLEFVQQSDKSKFAWLKSQFIEMFGDPITNDKGLPVEQLSKHIELLGGFAFKSTGFVKEGIPVLRIGNINSGYFRPDDLPFWKYDEALDRYLLYPGDLAISLTGTVGKDDYGNVCRLGDDYPRYYLNQRNAKLILKDTVLPEYITALLKNRKVKDKIANAGVGIRQANISNKTILELEVPVPDMVEQKLFAEFIKQSDKSKFFQSVLPFRTVCINRSLLQPLFFSHFSYRYKVNPRVHFFLLSIP